MNNSKDRIFLRLVYEVETRPRIEISKASKMFVLFPLHVRNVAGFQGSIVNTFLEKRSGIHVPAEQAHYVPQMQPLFWKDV